jgi:hypothetical protein
MRSKEEREAMMTTARWLTAQELAARWNVDDETVKRIPRARLGYLEFGRSRMRRYSPAEVDRYEATMHDEPQQSAESAA